MKYTNIVFTIYSILLLTACSNKGTTEYQNPNRFEIVEFKHVVETLKGGNIIYSYYPENLDSVEVKELSKMLKERGVSYFISSDGKLYYRANEFGAPILLGSEFILDRELVDRIYKKGLPRSKFVKDLIEEHKEE